MPQSTIILDIDGVLANGWHHDPKFRPRMWFEDMEADLGLDPMRFIKGYYETPLEDTVLCGQKTLEAAFDELLPSLGYRGSTQEFIHYWMEKDSVMHTPMIEAIEHLAARGDVTLALATNNEHVRMSYLMAHTPLGRLFPHVFFAADLGVKKPDLAFFQECNRRLGLKDGAAPLYFDDNPVIVEAAKAAGWEAVQHLDVSTFVEHPRVAPLLPRRGPRPPSCKRLQA